MKLTDNLKKQADNAADIEKNPIKKAGMKLSDDELDTVSGGILFSSNHPVNSGKCQGCPLAFTSACVECQIKGDSE